MECNYDDLSKTDVEQRSTSPERVEQLESRIKTLEAMLRESSIRTQPELAPSGRILRSSILTGHSPSSILVAASQSEPSYSSPLGAADLEGVIISAKIAEQSNTPLVNSSLHHIPYDTLRSEMCMVSNSFVEGVPGGTLPPMDVSTVDPWSSSTLPPIELLLHLVETFFACLPHAGRLLHRETFLAAIAQPPSSPVFPISALLHAICTVASFYTVVINPPPLPDIDDLPDEEIFPEGKQPFFKREFGECHAMWSSLLAYRASEKGLNMIQILQANVVLQWYHYLAGSSVNVWALNGKACRILPALGLNVSEGCNTLSSRLDQPYVIPNARSLIEMEGRRNLMWLVYIGERLGGAQTSWATVLDDNDISQLLPVSDLDFNGGHDLANEVRQRLASPNMLFNHPTYLKSSFSLLIKSVYLLSRVKSFNVRFRNLNGDEVDPKTSPDFVVLDDLLSRFRSSWPKEFANPISHHGRVDPTLYIADLIPNVATILLHDPHADFGLPKCKSADRIAEAVSLIMDAVHKITNTSYDIMLLDHYTTFCWFTAGTSLVRILRSKLNKGLIGDVIKINAELEMIRHLLRRMSERTLLGRRHLKLLNEHYEAEINPHRQSSPSKTEERQPGAIRVSEIIYNISRPAPSHRINPSAHTTGRDDSYLTSLLTESVGQFDWLNM